ncbi:unnamed protein product [Effrenium voratum]|uniref:Uncharacterized protein n=1 Tax=Effrenium voratum TaxID=2562239 RepID=A0AA36IW62_9DINO|nr:unnamed protein product [Effrenium voratum]
MLMKGRAKEPVSPTRLMVQRQLRCCGTAAPRPLQRFVTRLADFSVPFLEQHRCEVLCTSGLLVIAGMVLSMASLVGGLARGTLLEHLSWINLESDEEQRFLGMRFVCIAEGPLLSPAFQEAWSGSDRCIPLSALVCEAPDPMSCRSWDANCLSSARAKASSWERAQCSACRNSTVALLLPILISTATYLKLMHGVFVRLSGRDAALNKCTLVFAGLLGGLANLFIMGIYYVTCISTLQRAEIFLQPMLGPGFGCVLLATIFKLSAAFLNLALPLEACSDVSSEEP